MTTPAEVWPADAAIEALDGEIDADTGLPYIPKGTGPTSSPTYEIQYNRRQQRENSILAGVRELQVVDEGSLDIGVYAGDYRLGGTPKTFAGATGQAVNDDDTSYVYIDSSNALQIVTDATGWPADASTFVPLAEVTAASGDITAIVDRRNWMRNWIVGANDATGTTNTTFEIDSDATAVTLKNVGGALHVRDDGDSDYEDIKCATVECDGDTAQLGTGGTGLTLKNVSGELQIRDEGDSDDNDLKCGTLNAVDGLEFNGTDYTNRLCSVAISAAAEAGNTRAVTFQATDLAGNAEAQRFLMHIWLADADFGAELSSAPQRRRERHHRHGARNHHQRQAADRD